MWPLVKQKLDAGRAHSHIAVDLNLAGFRTVTGRRWNRYTVQRLVTTAYEMAGRLTPHQQFRRDAAERKARGIPSKTEEFFEKVIKPRARRKKRRNRKWSSLPRNGETDR